MNVLDIIPASRNLIFDALIFNGSLDIILSSKQLNEIYKKWLRNTSFENRATFLLKRMEVLANKHDIIFAINDKNLIKLNRAARGDKSVVTDCQSVSGKYKKPPIIETETPENPTTNTKNLGTSSSNPVDVNENFREISNIDPTTFHLVNAIFNKGSTRNFTISIDID